MRVDPIDPIEEKLRQFHRRDLFRLDESYEFGGGGIGELLIGHGTGSRCRIWGCVHNSRHFRKLPSFPRRRESSGVSNRGVIPKPHPPLAMRGVMHTSRMGIGYVRRLNGGLLGFVYWPKLQNFNDPFALLWRLLENNGS